MAGMTTSVMTGSVMTISAMTAGEDWTAVFLCRNSGKYF
jgi:hypothetical protein